jgi:hypothetical protein
MSAIFSIQYFLSFPSVGVIYVCVVIFRSVFLDVENNRALFLSLCTRAPSLARPLVRISLPFQEFKERIRLQDYATVMRAST